MSTFPAELTGTWQIDPSHSAVGFTAKHALVTTVRGRFETYQGGATIDVDSPDSSALWIEIDAASVNTGSEQRDGHLRSADFFTVESNPKITFKSTGVKLDGDDIVTTGDLTVLGTTRPVELTWEFGGIATDPFGNVRAGFEGHGELSRKDFGLTWNAPLEAGGVLVSDKIKLVIDISAIKQA